MHTASFGEWVRRRRLTLDLTQAELAERVACARITVRKIEGDERRPSRQMAERLADALELDGDSRDQFVAAARAIVSPARLASPATSAAFGPGGELPAPPNRLIGRADELDHIIDRLASSGGPARVLSIIGPPGVGKTRLALEVAARVLAKFDVPTVFVDLSVVTDPADVPARVAACVSTPSAALVDVESLAIHALRRAPTLLVLDNFEHVLDAADHVQSLVEACPDLVCVVTSRSPLDLYGEHLVPLEPLGVETVADPAHHEGAPHDDADALPPAVELFVERATAADPRLDVTGDLGALTEICRLLDGLPLAIELAALRVRQLPPTELLHRLRTDSRVLGETRRGRSDRQRSAEGAVAWSVDLLSPAARRALVTAGVFPGGFDIDLLGALEDGDLDLASALDELTSQSLVRAATMPSALLPGRVVTRFEMLMVVREFARRHLEADGRFDAVRTAHAQLIAARVNEISPGIDAWPERSQIDQLHLLDQDARAAMTWCFGAGRDPALGRRVLLPILTLWHFRGSAADCLRWSTVAYASLEPGDDRCESAYLLAVSHWASGDLPAATRFIEEAVRSADANGEVRWLAEAVGMQQLLAISAGDLVGAEALAPRSIATAAEAGGEWQLLAELRAGTLALLHGDLDRAAAHEARCAELVRTHPSSWGCATASGLRGDLALARGDSPAAMAAYREAVSGFSSVDAEVYAVARTASVANSLVAAGDPGRAAAICGVVDGWCERTGAPVHPLVAFSYAVHRAAVIEQLGGRFDDLAASWSCRDASVATIDEILATPMAP